MSHDYHDGAAGTLFYDGCGECEVRAASGISGLLDLDQPRIEVLWRRMLVTEGKGKGVVQVDGIAGSVSNYPVRHGYLSDAEARIGRQLYYLALLAERSGNPDAWAPGRFYRGGDDA